MKRVVIVGAGQAGFALAAKLRSEGFDGSVNLIGEERLGPYNRPRLSKDYLSGAVAADRLLLRPASFYAANDIDLRLDTRIEAIDPRTRTVAVSTGETISYDALALTTGARPKRLPPSVVEPPARAFVLRDLEDADRLAPELTPGRRVLVVGGGYLGLEAAAVCAKRDLRVEVVESAPRILQRVACRETSDFFRALHRRHGVSIREGVGVERIRMDSGATRAVLTDGCALDIDLVIAAVGVEPNVALAQEAGLAIENGIRTDEYARTSDPHIWAAGDCASLPFGGQRIRIESVGNGIAQAEAAAASILGRATPYAPAAWFWSDQYDVKLQIAGLCEGYDRVFTRCSGAARSHWYYRGSKLVTVDAINDSRAYMVAKRLLDAGVSPAPELVMNTGADLRTLLPA